MLTAKQKLIVQELRNEYPEEWSDEHILREFEREMLNEPPEDFYEGDEDESQGDE